MYSQYLPFVSFVHDALGTNSVSLRFLHISDYPSTQPTTPHVASLQAYNSMSSNGDSPNGEYSTSSNTTPPMSARNSNSPGYLYKNNCNGQQYGVNGCDQGVQQVQGRIVNGNQSVAHSLTIPGNLPNQRQNFQFDPKLLFSSSPQLMQCAFESPMRSQGNTVHDSPRTGSSGRGLPYPTSPLRTTITSTGAGGGSGSNGPSQFGNMMSNGYRHWNLIRNNTAPSTPSGFEQIQQNPMSCNQTPNTQQSPLPPQQHPARLHTRAVFRWWDHTASD